MNTIQTRDLAQALLASLSAQRERPPKKSVASVVGSNQALTMDQVLAVMPRHKLTRDDFRNEEYKNLKEKADLEASLPPEHVPLINRMDLLGTLHATWKTMYYQTTPGINLVQILRPQTYSSAKLEDLSCSMYTLHALIA